MAQTKKQSEWYQNNKIRLIAERKTYYNDNKEKISKRNTAKRRLIESRFKKSKNEAKRRQIEFQLTLEYYSFLVEMPCYYCDNKLGKPVVAGIGLDRCDNGLGYIINNVVSCCKICNLIKNKVLTSEEAKVAIDAVVNLRNSKLNLEGASADPVR